MTLLKLTAIMLEQYFGFIHIYQRNYKKFALKFMKRIWTGK